MFKSFRNSFRGNSTATPKQKAVRNKQFKQSTASEHDDISSHGTFTVDEIDNEELAALKQVCLSYIDMIEFEIDAIPEKKDNESEPDFEPIFLRLKTYVSTAKRQLGRQEINREHNERTIELDANALAALPDLPMETPSTPLIRSLNGYTPELAALDGIILYIFIYETSLHSI